MKALDKKEGNRLAILVVNVTRQLVRNGAEIYRAEDTARRMCARYSNIEYVNIYATYNMVMVNFSCGGEDFFTMRTFQGVEYNLQKVARVNDFSRKFTSGSITIEEGIKLIEKIYLEEDDRILAPSIYAGFGSAFLIYYFNGGIQDFLITLIAAFCGQWSLIKFGKRGLPIFVNTLLGCAVSSTICHILMRLGFGTSINIIITGAIMPFLPGISFTNSIRDFLSGDMSSGLYGLVQSLIIAAGMAIGVGITFSFFS
ncbi:MAG: threonine/serine exporter family protein [Lagierella massiliensis]|nr:threonine/serine exporter family protein [Lagierella massiliensis]